MPHCENEGCTSEVKPDELYENGETGSLLCEGCANKVPLVKIPHNTKLFGREFEYGVAYTSEEGLRVHARLGGARLSLNVEQSEFNKIFGTE